MAEILKRAKTPVIFLLCLLVAFHSEGGDKEKFSPAKARKDAEKYMEEGNTWGAIYLFEKVLEVEPEDLDLKFKLANAYYSVRDYRKAVVLFRDLSASPDVKYELASYYYGLCLKSTGNYDEAIKVFNDFRKVYKGADATELKRVVKVEIEGCQLAKEKLGKPLPVRVSNLGSPVNGIYMDFAPVLWGDSALVYASLVSDSVILEDKNTKDPALVKMYKTVKTGSTWSDPDTMDHPFNSSKYHIANGTFSPNRARFYFTLCDEDDAHVKLCAIYYSDRIDGLWQEPVKLNDMINNTRFTSTQPAVADYKDGMQVLYFVSDRPEGGQGGLDIWYSIIGKKGDFGEPKNLGRKLNSTLDEMSPFYDHATGTMYFSSKGLPGFGGFDIFKVQGNMKKWTPPVNMGYPVNSGADDLYYVIKESQEDGFLVSNRSGSQYFKSETCCDDIYSVKWLKLLRFAVTGNVFEVGDTLFKPINGAQVTLYLTSKAVSDDEKEGETTVETEETPIKVDSIVNGMKYFFTLTGDQTYRLTANKPGWLSGTATVSTMGLTESDTLLRNLFLGRYKAYQVRNIYYGFDSTELRAASKNGLDSLVHIMELNPQIIVEIGSHTDSVGSDEYNIKLSQGRAESVVTYLIKHGIPPARLTAKGYGEAQPIAANTNPDGTDNPEGRQLNRRTEFKIIGEIENVEYIDPEEDLREGRHKAGGVPE